MVGARRALSAALLGIVSAGLCGAAVGQESERSLFNPDRAELGGYVEAEARGFPERPLQSAQEDYDFSAAIRPEIYLQWGDSSVTFTPFLRLDQMDSERTHGDIRELFYQYKGDDWEARVGIGKVFWGVTEGRHVVDIINQTDLVEDPRGEDKLGQPMVNLSLFRDWGTLELFVLPGFRERTFPGREGRFRTTPRPDPDRTIYESGQEEWHVDYAARFSRRFGDLDVALSYFYGTTREPVFELGIDPDRPEPILIPRYDLIHQPGLEMQYAFGSTLLKLESFVRAGQGKTFVAGAAGFEHTFSGVFGTQIDLGLIGEYLFETRDCCIQDGEIFFNPPQDDILVGLRFALNDTEGTRGLVSMIQDRTSTAKVFRLEASRRLTDHIRLEIEAGALVDIPDDDPLYTLRRDTYGQARLRYYF